LGFSLDQKGEAEGGCRVAAFLKKYPGIPFCDACLAEETGMSPAAVTPAARRLKERGQAARSHWWCGGCLKRTTVTETPDVENFLGRLG
jgi:hypothetical protein